MGPNEREEDFEAEDWDEETLGLDWDETEERSVLREVVPVEGGAD